MFKHVKTDPELCIGCKTCVAACVVSHTGRIIFSLQPGSYDFAPRIHVEYTDHTTRAVQCQQCPKPLCLTACPFHCISLGSDRVVIDEGACHGCGRCAKACPFNAIIMTKLQHTHIQNRSFRLVALKCDLCALTETGQPACIPACPTEALSLVDPAALAAERAKKKKEKEALQEQKAYEKALRKGQE